VRGDQTNHSNPREGWEILQHLEKKGRNVALMLVDADDKLGDLAYFS